MLKKVLKVFLSMSMVLLIIPIKVSAEEPERRVQVVPCSGSDVDLTYTGSHLEIVRLFSIGCFPGSSYTVSAEMIQTISTNAGVSILEGLIDLGVETSISTSSSVGLTVINTSNVHSQAALWVSYDDYSAVELDYLGNGTCAVYRSTVEVPDYYLYGFENSH